MLEINCEAVRSFRDCPAAGPLLVPSGGSDVMTARRLNEVITVQRPAGPWLLTIDVSGRAMRTQHQDGDPVGRGGDGHDRPGPKIPGKPGTGPCFVI